MSNFYKHAKDVPTTAIIARLKELAIAVSDRKLDEFTMRIPAELDRDADLVLSIAADRLEAITFTPEGLEGLQQNTIAIQRGLKDHEIRELTNVIVNDLRNYYPNINWPASLREIIAGTVREYFKTNNLNLDKHD